MKHGKRTACAAILAICLLSSCNQATVSGATTDAATQTTPLLTSLNPVDLFSDRDKSGDYEESTAIDITLNGTTATATDNTKVSINGTKVTLRDEGVYVLQGKLTNGQIIVDAEDSDKVQLVLNGVTIQNDTSAAIYVRQADKVFVTLAKGTANTLSNKKEFVAIDENNIDGVIFAKDDLTLNGSGALTVNALYGNGVVAKDDLTVTGGTYTITAAEHGLDAKDSIAIADGTFKVTAGKDGFHCDNSEDTTKGFIYVGGGSYTLTATGDGFDASSLIQIEKGTFQVKTGGGTEATLAADASAKGIKASGNLLLNGGTFTMDCADDGFHSNANLTVKSGIYTVATGDDGFHADLAATVDGGTINITKSYEGIEGQTVVINGGTIDIVASDDGLNAAEGGEDTEDAMIGDGEKGSFNPKERPANGEKPAFGDGSLPQNGEQPTGETATPPTERPTKPETTSKDTAATGTSSQAKAEGMANEQMGGGFRANENCKITITGGTLTLNTKGDSIDSNGNISITGGTIYIIGPENNGNSCIDSDGDAVITGGILVACGSSSMFHGFATDSTQGWALINLTASKSGTVTLTDGSTTLLTYTPNRAYNAVLVSSPSLKNGGSYSLTIGEETQTFTMEGQSYTLGTAPSGMSGRGQMNGERRGKTDATQAAS